MCVLFNTRFLPSCKLWSVYNFIGPWQWQLHILRVMQWLVWVVEVRCRWAWHWKMEKEDRGELNQATNHFPLSSDRTSWVEQVSDIRTWPWIHRFIFSFVHLFIYLFIYLFIVIAIAIANVIVIVIRNVCRCFLLLFWVVFPLKNHCLSHLKVSRPPNVATNISRPMSHL